MHGCRILLESQLEIILSIITHHWILCIFPVNGENERFSCHNFNKDEVGKWLGYLTTRSGIPCIRFRKYQHTDYPSIQGVWTPFTHQAPELNSAEFPHVSVLLQLKFNLTIKNEVINILSLGGTF